MRGNVPAFHVEVPHDLQDALSRLASDPELSPLAGGTDVMVLLEAGHLEPGRFLNIWGLDELRGVRVSDDEVRVGALTRYRDIIAHPIFSAEYPMMVDAARLSGAAAIQNRGTLGGNIVNASPAADTPPCLMVYEAEVELMSQAGGIRRVPYTAFHHGYKAIERRHDELLTAVLLPREPGGQGAIHHYRKVGTRKAQAISKVVFAGVVRADGGRIAECRMALGSVGPTVMRCSAAEEALSGLLIGDALERVEGLVADEVTPIDDVRSTAAYRAAISGRVARECIGMLLQ